MAIFETVQLEENQGWDPRILVCAYDLRHAGNVLHMYVHIVISERYVIFIDTLVNDRTTAALVDIARPHLDGRQILVVNTHADYDHAWGNSYFAYGDEPHRAHIIGTRACAARLQDAVTQDLLDRLQAEDAALRDVQFMPPTITFDNSLTIDGGDLTLNLIVTPGHTHDHCSVYIPEIDTLLAGDAAEAPFPTTNEGTPIALHRSLQKLAALKPTTAFYCHAPFTAGPELLQSNLTYMETIESRCRQALEKNPNAASVSLSDVEAVVGYSYEEAIPPELREWAVEGFNHPIHQLNMAAMLRELSDSV